MPVRHIRRKREKMDRVSFTKTFSQFYLQNQLNPINIREEF